MSKGCLDIKDDNLDCDSDIKSKTAKEVCGEVNEKSNSVLGILGDVLNNFTPGGIIKAFTSNNEVRQKVKNIINLDIIDEQIQDISQSCSNTVNNSQVNFIGYTPECIEKALGDTTGKDRIELLKILKGQTIENIKQINKAKTIDDCVSSSIVKFLATSKSSITNEVIAQVIQKAKGLMTSNKSSSEICNNISSKISGCKYLKIRQCCQNDTKLDQINTIECPTADNVKDIIQENDKVSYNTCSLSSESGMSSDLAGDIVNKTETKTKQTAEGLDMNFLLILIAIVAFVVIGPVAIAGNKVLSKLGIILLMIGIGFIVVYFTTIQKEKVKLDEPYVSCSGTKIDGLEKMQYGEAKKKVDSSNEYIGFDFIAINVDKKEADPIKSNTNGLVTFITELDENECSEKIDKDKERTKSYIKKKDTKWYLYVGIALIVGGFVQMLIGMSSSSKKPSEISSSGKIQNPNETQVNFSAA